MGTPTDPKFVKVNIMLDPDFKAQLWSLLKEFRDIFAWDYSNMPRMDQMVCQHRINLRQDAILVI